MSKLTTVISVRGRDRNRLIGSPGFVYVGRACGGYPSSIWGNPFRSGMDPFAAMRIIDGIARAGHARKDTVLVVDGRFTAEDAVEWYRSYVQADRRLWDRLPELRGKTLGCWCCDRDGTGEPAKPCHAVVLARLADGMEAASA